MGEETLSTLFSTRGELANHPDKNHIKLKSGTEVGDSVRNDRKKAPLIWGWELHFLRGQSKIGYKWPRESDGTVRMQE